MKKLTVFAVVCLCLAFALPALASSAYNNSPLNELIIGNPPDAGDGNCFPFGCSYTTNYQQLYSHTQFSTGPIMITGLEFFNTQFDNGATQMNSGNWTISLSTSSHDWNTLSSTFTDNLGADNTVVFSGNLSQPWSFGDTLTINFTTGFLYDPSEGNLLISIDAEGTSAPGGNIYFDTNGYNDGQFNGNDYLGRVYCNGCGQTSGTVNSGYGLVTGFLYEQGQQTVPEPSTFLMLGSGLAGAVAFARRRLQK